MIDKSKTIFRRIIILLFFLYLIPQVLVIIYSFKTPQKSDALLVLGSTIKNSYPENMLKYRLDKAVDLYNNGFGEYIIVSGGQGQNENTPEGEVMKKYLLEKGINESKIIDETSSTSTYENLKFSKQIIENKFDNITIVTSRFHIFRSLITAKKLKLNVSFAGSKVDIKDLWNYLREVPAIYKYIIKY